MAAAGVAAGFSQGHDLVMVVLLLGELLYIHLPRPGFGPDELFLYGLHPFGDTEPQLVAETLVDYLEELLVFLPYVTAEAHDDGVYYPVVQFPYLNCLPEVVQQGYYLPVLLLDDVLQRLAEGQQALAEAEQDFLF